VNSNPMEYDPFSAAFQADPFPVYRWMRDEAPASACCRRARRAPAAPARRPCSTAARSDPLVLGL